MEFEFIIYEKDPKAHIARVTMNRPRKLNCLTQVMYKEIGLAMEDAEDDDDIKVIILRGAGKSFSTGQDLSEVGFIYGFQDHGKARRPSQKRRMAVDKRWMENLAKVFYCNKATIAQVQGHCLGAGLDLFMSCDLSVVAEDAQFGHPGQRLVGPAFDFNMPLYLWKLGPTLAKNILFTGDSISGRDAERWGIVTKVVPAERLAAETEALARKVALMPGDGIVMGKAGMRLAADIMGIGAGYSYGPIAHTWGTNLRFEADEHNFFHARSDKGAREAFHERDERFAKVEQRKKGDPK